MSRLDGNSIITEWTVSTVLSRALSRVLWHVLSMDDFDQTASLAQLVEEIRSAPIERPPDLYLDFHRHVFELARSRDPSFAISNHAMGMLNNILNAVYSAMVHRAAQQALWHLACAGYRGVT